MKTAAEIFNYVNYDKLTNYFKDFYSYDIVNNKYHVGESCTNDFPIYSIFKNKTNTEIVIYVGYVKENNLIFYHYKSIDNLMGLDLNKCFITINIEKFTYDFQDNILILREGNIYSRKIFSESYYHLVTDINEKNNLINMILKKNITL